MNKNYFFIASLLLVIACNQKPQEESKSNTPDFFGWTEQHIATLKTECLERYGKEGEVTDETTRENYCSCFVEKIIHSVKFEQHKSPNEETVKLYSEFSVACKELTKTESGKEAVQ